MNSKNKNFIFGFKQEKYMKPIFKTFTKFVCTAFVGLLFAVGAAAQAGYTVSGHVEDQNSNPISNLTITALYNGGPTSAITDVSGNYSITVPEGVQISIEPSPTPNTEFSPPSASLSLAGNYTQDFLAYVTAQASGYTVQGTIEDISSNTVSGVTVKGVCGGTEYSATGSDGYYEIAFPAEVNNTTCNIVPVPANPSLYYEPAQIEVTLTQNLSANFTQHVWPNGGQPTWQLVNVAADAAVTAAPAIAGDNAGNAHLAYVSSNGYVSYSVFYGSSSAWQFGESSDVNSTPSISPYNGKGYMAYKRTSENDPPELRFAHNEPVYGCYA